jgi:hypothetical protein
VNFALLDSRVQVTEGGPSIAGQNNRYNNIQIDGAVNNDVFGLADSGIPGGQVGAKSISLEAVQEFQVLTAPYDVRYSGFSGGLLNAVTKSGTNTTSGSVFGFFTNENLQGSLTVDDETVDKDPFKNTQFGFTLGGPISRDKIHYFVGGEFQIYNGPTTGFGVDPLGPPTQPGAANRGIDPDSAQRLIDIMGDTYGVSAEEVGTSDNVTLDNPRTNLFARVDFQLSDNHRLVIRDNYAKNRADRPPFRASFFYGYTSQNQDFTNTTNTLVAQLFSTFGGEWSNELLFNWGIVRDLRDPIVDYAQIEVDNDSGELGSNTLVIGAEEFSQANSLDQDFFQLTDNLSRSWGAHRMTFGANVEYFKFDNLFFPASIGVYQFDSLADLENGVVGAYEVNTLNPAITDPAAKFGVWQPGFYAQDEWAINQNWNLQLGLRVDIPIMADKPPANPAFESAFGISTTEVPSGNILWQPRVGFNWQSGAQRMTQVRGGAGLFSGRPPYVWLSNNYTNTGGQQVKLFCDTDNAPAFNRGNYPGSPPQQCTDGTTAAQSGLPVVNIWDPNTRFPLEGKLNLAVDQVLPAGGAVHEGRAAALLRGVQHTVRADRNRPDAGRPAAVRHADRQLERRSVRSAARERRVRPGDPGQEQERQPVAPAHARGEPPDDGVARPERRIHLFGRGRHAGPVLESGDVQLRPERDPRESERARADQLVVRAPAPDRSVGHVPGRPRSQHGARDHAHVLRAVGQSVLVRGARRPQR